MTDREERLRILQQVIQEVSDESETDDELEEIGALLLGASAQIALGELMSVPERDARKSWLSDANEAWVWAREQMEQHAVNEVASDAGVNAKGGEA